MGVRLTGQSVQNKTLTKLKTQGSANSAGSASSVGGAGSANAAKKPTITYEVKMQAFEQPNSRPCASSSPSGTSGGINPNHVSNSAFITYWREQYKSVTQSAGGSGSDALKNCRKNFEEDLKEYRYELSFIISKLEPELEDINKQIKEVEEKLSNVANDSAEANELKMQWTKLNEASVILDRKIANIQTDLNCISNFTFDELAEY